MVRGYQRRVVFLKNTDSELFEEAYFLLRDSERSRSADRQEMIKEANKIIEESQTARGAASRGLRHRRRHSTALSFVIGAFSGAVSSLLLFILFLN